MIDNMYPDSFPPEYGIPACVIMLGLYFYSVIKERRAEVKARIALRKGNK